MGLKLRLYVAAVTSILSYGAETWTLSAKVLRQLNGANSLMLAHITGNSIPQEARSNTTSFDLTLNIRRRRFKYLGLILRDKQRNLDKPDRLVYVLIKEQYANTIHGDLLVTDAPPHASLEELRMLAINKSHWELLASRIT